MLIEAAKGTTEITADTGTANPFRDVLDAQARRFALGVTRSYGWRTEQLDRMGWLIRENEQRLHDAMVHDFKTASSEYVFETLSAVGEVAFQKSPTTEHQQDHRFGAKVMIGR